MTITSSRARRRRWPTRSVAVFSAAAVSAFGLTGCTPAGQMECPVTAPASYVGVDVSQTSRSDTLRADRLEDIRSHVEYASLCHGSLKIELFSSGTGATATLFDAHLEAEGGTLPARKRHLDEVVEPTMSAITSEWDEVEAALPADGSDVVGQLELMAEYFAQHPGSDHRGLLLTDGVQTAGVVVLNDESVTEAVAVELAESVPVPHLSGVELTIAGIGRVAGKPPPSSYVTALKRFYEVICERSGAAECLVVSDLTSGGEGR